jgi:hypothetical protein
MMVRSFAHIAAAWTVVFALAAVPVSAGGHGQDGNGGNQGGQTSSMSAEQAAAIVQRAYGGRVVSVKPTGGGGYSVRVVLDGGRVKTVQVDGNGGLSESN